MGSVRPQLPCTALAWLQVHSMRGGQPLPKNPTAHSPCNSSLSQRAFKTFLALPGNPGSGKGAPTPSSSRGVGQAQTASVLGAETPWSLSPC